MAESLAAKRDKVVGIVRAEGPLLPVNIAKKLDLNITFASAILSELVDNKALKITSVKYGGSPFYYVEGQEFKLQNLMKHLNHKDMETAELLKNKKILCDKDLDTLQRFGLRQIKDFAKPVNVNVNNETNLFWKWYLAGDQDVRDSINKYLEARLPRAVETKVTELKGDVPDIRSNKEEQIKLEKIYERELKKETKPKLEVLRDEKQKEEKIKTEDEDFTGKIKYESPDPLANVFVNSQIDILDQKVVKKNKEINYIAGINTDLGKGIFFLKYKSKGRVNEADLSLAMHEAGKLPLIFLSTGELTKKARELLGAEFKGVIFKKI